MTSSPAAAADASRDSPPPALQPQDAQVAQESSAARAPLPNAPAAAMNMTTSNSADAGAPASATISQPSGEPSSAQEPRDDRSMPSPPTVSPLSTPAVTAPQNMNGDHDSDVPRPSQLPPASSTSIAALQNFTLEGDSTRSNSATRVDTPVAPLDQPLANPSLLPNLQEARIGPHASVATTDDDLYLSSSVANLGLMPRSASMPNIDASALLMMSLAQTTSAPTAMEYPPAIAPSEISLPASMTQGSHTGSGTSISAGPSQKLESFARIEFADSVFQMTTYAVIIGRDQRAMKQAQRDEWRQAKYQRQAEENERAGLPPPTPIARWDDKTKFSKSYISEEGGMLGPESDGEDSTQAPRRHTSHHGDDEDHGEAYQSNRQYVSHTEGAAAIDMNMLQPSPSHIPFIGIHSPGPNIAKKTKAISRQHLKIQFNEKRGVFEAISLHKNGFFCEEIHYGMDEPATIRSGDHIQIKDVGFTFVINGVSKGKTGAEEYDEDEEHSRKSVSVGGQEMSLEFEHSDNEKKKFLHDTSDELSDVENVPTPSLPSDEEADRRAAPKASQPVHAEPPLANVGLQSAEAAQQLPPGLLIPGFIPRKRGPGRPPKDGIMSKRKRRLLKKQEQEAIRKLSPQEPLGEKIKRPVGRPRKNPLPEDGERTEKRKYTKRKKEDGEGSDAERRKEKNDKKVRSKSPPLELKKEDFTDEQLQKPSKNYGVLIDEALTNGPPDGLTLKQIYKRIMAKYPWFYFSAETKGWESSVRHNLIGNEAFKKDEETSLWSRVPGVELDAGKKRKATSPDRQMGHPSGFQAPHMQQQPYFNGGYMHQGGYNYGHNIQGAYNNVPNQSHTGYQTSTQAGQAYPGPQVQPTGQQAYSQQQQAPGLAQTSSGAGPALMSRQSVGTQPTSYSSPYARQIPPTNQSIKQERPSTNIQSHPPANPQAAPYSSTPSQPPNTASGAPLAPGRAPISLTPELEKALTLFKNNMVTALSRSNDKAAQIVDTAINRALGRPAQPTLPGLENVEKTIVNAVQGLIQDQTKRASASPAPAPPVAKQATPLPAQSPAPTASVEAEIQKRVKSFRDKMIAALGKKTPQAEAIVDSAINRALGRANPGPFAGWEQADKLMYESISKTINDTRKSYNLPPLPVGSAPALSRPSQTPQPSQPSHLTSSASPAPAPSTPTGGSNNQAQSNGNAAFAHPGSIAPGTPSTPSSLSTGRPALSIARPSSIGAGRPGAVSVARPSLVRKNSIAAPTTAAPATSASSAATAQTSTQRPTAPGSQGANQPVPVTTSNSSMSASATAPLSSTPGNSAPPQTPNFTSAAHVQSTAGIPPASGTSSQGTASTITARPLVKSASPAPPPPPTTRPSAGAIEQIMGQKQTTTHPSAGAIEQITGQKRTIDSIHGPGSMGMGQPEPKKLATPTTTT